MDILFYIHDLVIQVILDNILVVKFIALEHDFIMYKMVNINYSKVFITIAITSNFFNLKDFIILHFQYLKFLVL